MHIDGEEVKEQGTAFHRQERSPDVNFRELHNWAQEKKGGGRVREGGFQKAKARVSWEKR